MPRSLPATPSVTYSQQLVLDPLEYGFYLADGEVLMPTERQNSIDKKHTMICNCGVCVRNTCPCPAASVAYTHLCNCKNQNPSPCKHPN